RGDEWIASFPKNVLLYQAFGWEIPKFIHTPLILNKEGGKLSKRQGDVTVENYKDQGYLPEALINFSALLGWHPKDEKEILSLNETIEKFNIKDIRASSAVFDPEKLDYLNGYYIRKMPLNKLTELCSPYLIKQTTESRQQTTEFIKKVISLEQERMKKLSEIGELTEFFFVDKLQYEPELLIWKKMSLEEVKNNLGKIYTLLEKIPKQSWTNNSIQEAIMTYLQAKELKTGEYLWPMRVALTGRKASPGPFDVAEVLGKEKSLERIDLSRNKLCNVPPQL
ncbi:glutamate--tRNA ligase, partial [Patescibacteria group bacterium]|nr:glutamate--tRNA ligase [Patescibacteria group bacterium]